MAAQSQGCTLYTSYQSCTSLITAANFKLRAAIVRRQQRSTSVVKTIAAAGYSVTLKTPDREAVVKVEPGMYILDAAEDTGVRLPYSCRSGACSSCAAILTEGAVDQSDQTFLTDAQLDAGWVLTCVAYPLSDAALQTHMEAALYNST